MPTYLGKAPLTLVPTLNGHAEYVYAGSVAPDGIKPADLERLLDEGFLVEVAVPEEFVVIDPLVDAGLVEPPAGVVDVSTDSGAVADGGRPAKTANKETWVDFRVAESQGRLTREQLDELTKVELQDDEALAVLFPQS
jgi:hypothetical protein